MWQKVFLRNDELRPVWRCFFSVVLLLLGYIGCSLLLGVIFSALGTFPGRMVILFWVNLLVFPVMLVCTGILTRVFESRRLSSAGLAFHRRWSREVALGIAMGAVMIALVGLVERLAAGTTFPIVATSPERFFTAGSFTFITLGCAAANEELMFRGYPFQRLVDALGPWGATLIFAVGFGLVHLGNPDHTWFSTFNTVLVGILLAIAYLRTRSLWLPWGLHFSWNFCQGFILGLPVSGLNFPASFLHPRLHGPEWLTGGSYGPEGGILTTVVIAIASLYLLFSKRIQISEDMRALVFGPPVEKSHDSAVALILGDDSDSPGPRDPQ
jgi:membrane protease YdiL (CAAX protease family)